MAQLPIGLNIEAAQWWTRTQPWADLAHQLGTSGAATTPWNSAAVDANGWPTGTSGQTTLRSGTGNTGPAGAHAVSFQTSDASATCAITNCTMSGRTVTGSGPYTVSYTATYSGSGDLTFSYASSSGGIRNLSVLLPGHTSGDLLSSAFAAKARPFAALRFYQAQGEEGYGVNLNTDKLWTNRRRPTFATWAAYGNENTDTSKGIPFEAMILVCNKLGVDCWVNVPYRTLGDADSTDDYVTKMAQVFRYGSNGTDPYTSAQASPVYPPLNPGLNVYVEFGNELWNGAYPYSRDKSWNDAAAASAGISSQRRIGRLVYRLSTIWRTVWSGYSSRVRIVAPGMVGNTGWNQPILDEIIAQGGTPLSQFVHGLAVAPYFNNGGSTVDAVIANMVTERTDLVGDTVGRALNADANLCASYGIKMVAYEGGIGNLSVTDQAVGNAVQVDDRVRTQVLEPYLTSWFGKSMAGLFTYYTLIKPWQVGQNGFFGLYQNVADADGPKVTALKNIRGTAGLTIVAGVPSGGFVRLSGSRVPGSTINVYRRP